MELTVCPPVLVTVTCTFGIGNPKACELLGKFAGDGLTVSMAGPGGAGERHPALMSPTAIAIPASPRTPERSAVPASLLLAGIPIGRPDIVGYRQRGRRFLRAGSSRVEGKRALSRSGVYFHPHRIQRPT